MFLIHFLPFSLSPSFLSSPPFDPLSLFAVSFPLPLFLLFLLLSPPFPDDFSVCNTRFAFSLAPSFPTHLSHFLFFYATPLYASHPSSRSFTPRSFPFSPSKFTFTFSFLPVGQAADVPLHVCYPVAVSREVVQIRGNAYVENLSKCVHGLGFSVSHIAYLFQLTVAIY